MMKHPLSLAILALTLLLTSPVPAAEEAKKDAAKPAPGTEMVERGWKGRCPDAKPEDKKNKKQCEVFQRIDVKGADNTRVAEFALGFPDDKKLEKGAGLGAVILPLGILLDQPVGMKVDDGKSMSFRLRFCTTAGCVGYVTLPKAVVETMKTGKTVTFGFKTAEGRDVNLLMSLNGFDKALKDLQ